MSQVKLVVVALVFLAVALVGSSVFQVDETQQALVLRLGQPVRMVVGGNTMATLGDLQRNMDERAKTTGRTITLKVGAGLCFKMPLVERVLFFDDRLLEYYSAEPTDVVTRDKKHLLVDNFAWWRIVNPVLYYESVRDESGATARLDDITFSTVREILAQNDLVEVVRTSNKLLQEEEQHDRASVEKGREAIMQSVSDIVHAKALAFGINVVEVRIKRADLPSENEQAVFGRMKAERERVSKKYRSEGQEFAQTIRAQTDLEVAKILTEAKQAAEIIRGGADARASAIYAAVYGGQPDFYSFQKTLETIMSNNADTTVILSTKSDLFRVLRGFSAPKIVP